MPNEFLRDRLQRKLAALPDERLYQVLDFVEFLETKYTPEQPATSATGVFTRFAESLEDRLRAGKVNTQAIAETMNLMHRAVGVLNGVAAAGRSVASDIVDGVSRATTPGAPAGSPPARPDAGGAPPANPTAPSAPSDVRSSTPAGEPSA